MISIILALLFIHYIGDFILQSRWMAENKSKDISPLLCHVTFIAWFCVLG